MKNKIKNICIVIFSASLLSSCVNDTFDTPVQDACVSPGLTKTKEVANIYAVASNTTVTYSADDIIEAYVISSDEGGNFYKSMYFQPIDGSKGFNLSVDEVSAYAKKLQPGKKVFLKLKGLAYANPSSYGRGLIFGAPPTEQYAVDRLTGLEYQKYLIPSCDAVSEDAIVHKITLAQAFSDTYLNTLVEIDNVQFADESAGGTYDTNRTDNYDSSIYVTNGTSSLTIRTSRFASFAGYKVPLGKGKIRGVLSRYNSTYQIIMRTERDAMMSNERLDFNLPIGGSAIQYLPTFNENFESYAASTAGAVFPKYVNDAFLGSRYWDVKAYSGNKYIQMTSYNSGGSNKTYLAMPVAFTPGNKLSFKSKDGYNLGSVLKVYYSTNYVPGGDIGKATLVDITSSFAIAKGTTTGYATNFTNSGNYVIPSTLTGNGFFLFEYYGTSSITTTMQIDDIIVN
ncbi:DUF5689 domain-containing protein [uncultured Flavobacterium sp.]|jgi:hypothetical protein|uniref:DUF5689 domain-containing protein n=1 Tax=uncultured Flavobacterium sp. TaxID=165435 RepID=UPI0030CA171B